MSREHCRYSRAVAQKAYRGREPTAPMDASSLLAVVDLLEAEGIAVWLDGGWGVDALLGRQTREHDDLDVVVELADVSRITEVLTRLGYALVAGAAPKSFVMVDPRGLQVDVHPVTFDAEGGGVYEMEDGKTWVYPAPRLHGTRHCGRKTNPVSQSRSSGPSCTRATN